MTINESQFRVSVVIPAHNEEGTLEECLNSILRQSYSPFEIIVVDNASTDKTTVIVEAFGQIDQRIKLVRESQLGRGRARQRGLIAASGDIVVTTDADCLPAVDWLEELTKPLRLGWARLAVGVDEAIGKSYWAKHLAEANRTFQSHAVSGSWVNALDTKNFAGDAALLKKIGFNPAMRSLEDFELKLRLTPVAKIWYTPAAKVYHHYPETFAAVWRMVADRGFWAVVIFKQYQFDRVAVGEPFFSSLRWYALIGFPFWLIWESLKRPLVELPFLWTTEVAWRWGNLRGWLTKFFN